MTEYTTEYFSTKLFKNAVQHVMFSTMLRENEDEVDAGRLLEYKSKASAIKSKDDKTRLDNALDFYSAAPDGTKVSEISKNDALKFPAEFVDKQIKARLDIVTALIENKKDACVKVAEPEGDVIEFFAQQYLRVANLRRLADVNGKRLPAPVI